MKERVVDLIKKSYTRDEWNSLTEGQRSRAMKKAIDMTKGGPGSGRKKEMYDNITDAMNDYQDKHGYDKLHSHMTKWFKEEGHQDIAEDEDRYPGWSDAAAALPEHKQEKLLTYFQDHLEKGGPGSGRRKSGFTKLKTKQVLDKLNDRQRVMTFTGGLSEYHAKNWLEANDPTGKFHLVEDGQGTYHIVTSTGKETLSKGGPGSGRHRKRAQQLIGQIKKLKTAVPSASRETTLAKLMDELKTVKYKMSSSKNSNDLTKDALANISY